MNASVPNGSELPPLVLIAGATASGKSALALELAERIGGVIVNADSAQVYQDLRIVTARPSSEEEERVPHRLYGVRDGALPYSAADWAEDAKKIIGEVHSTGQVPVLVGGTGLYLRTLLDGIAPVPEIHPEIRHEVRSLTTEDAYVFLSREDPEAAARLRPSDTTRIARALEVVRATGRPLAEWQQERRGGIGLDVHIHPIILLPPRPWLYERCNLRFEAMLAPEGVKEVQSLLDRSLDPSLPVMRAIGVREIAAYLQGGLTYQQALDAGRAATRQYAKRQYTWFAHQPPSGWPRFGEPLEVGALDKALSFFREIA